MIGPPGGTVVAAGKPSSFVAVIAGAAMAAEVNKTATARERVALRLRKLINGFRDGAIRGPRPSGKHVAVIGEGFLDSTSFRPPRLVPVRGNLGLRGQVIRLIEPLLDRGISWRLGR